MIKGTLIAESMRVGSSLTGVRLVVRQVSRYTVTEVPGYQPSIWTNIEFEADDSAAEALAKDFAAIMDEPGWYVNYSSAGETFVVYHDQIFRYPRGDEAGRAEAQAYGRAHGVPENQLDWTE
jgi:hypothetical protein